MQISDKAAGMIKGNNRLIGRLMIAFDRHSKSIEDWAESRDIRLTTPTAVQIFKEETGLAESEILEPDPVKEHNH
jgi:hypothetical protein